MTSKTKNKLLYKESHEKKNGISRDRLREIVKEELLALREEWTVSPDGKSNCDYKNSGAG